jgi:O-antigen/teichoic acid export membrane protein
MIKKSVLIFVTLSIIASAMNYAVYPLFGRILTAQEYVGITVSLSLFTQMAAFLSSVTAITIGLSKSGSDNITNKKIELLQAYLLKLFFLLAIVFLVISPLVMNSVHTPVLFALPIATMMLFSIPIQIISGYLNGKNQMIKLGAITVVSAFNQFAIGLITAIVSRNGLITMLSMVAAQVVSLAVIYTVFSSDRLPGITKSIKTPIRSIRNQHMTPLLIYTALASIAIMTISVMQILDLFVVQNLAHTNIKLYTDIYVISRIVFFAGMIFIWPFLGEITLEHHHFNRRPFVKTVGCFAVITLIAILIIYFFGDQLMTTLFGIKYSIQEVRDLGILSVLYKFFLLIITSVVLYFVVLRSYLAIWFAMVSSLIIFVFSEFAIKSSDMLTVLIWVNIAAGILASIAILLLTRTRINR